LRKKLFSVYKADLVTLFYGNKTQFCYDRFLCNNPKILIGENLIYNEKKLK
jgi:hypothetical protein